MSSKLYRLTGAVQNAREYLEADASAWETGSDASPHRVYLHACAQLRRDVSAELEAATNAVAYAGLPDDVRALVIAAREAWGALSGKAEDVNDADVAQALFKALEAFSGRVAYDDEPGEPTCAECDGTGWKDHQGFGMDPCGCGGAPVQPLAHAPAARKRQPWPDAL